MKRKTPSDSWMISQSVARSRRRQAAERRALGIALLAKSYRKMRLQRIRRQLHRNLTMRVAKRSFYKSASKRKWKGKFTN